DVEIGSEWVKTVVDGKTVWTETPQTITLKIRVPILKITEVKFFDSMNLTGDLKGTDIYGNGAIYDPLQISNEQLLNEANYTSDIYAKLGDTPYSINTVYFANDTLRKNYFKVGAYGDIRNGTMVRITVMNGTAVSSQFAYVSNWEQDIKLSVLGQEQDVKFTVGNKTFTATQFETPNLTFSDAKFDATTLQPKLTDGLSSTDYVFTYNAFDEWKLPTSGKFTSGQTGQVVEGEYVTWLENNAPDITSADVKTDAGGTYVERKFAYFANTPIHSDHTAKIYVTGINTDVANVTFANDDFKHFVPFTNWSLPSTATVTHKDNTQSFNVPVVWDKNRPTYLECTSGSFTRKAIVGGDSPVDVTISAEKYVINYGAEYDNQSGETFRLTTSNFYKGLPKHGTVVVGNNLSVIDVDFEWRLGAEATSEFVTYDAATGFDGNVYVVIKNANRVLRDTPVKLTVDKAGITGISDYQNLGFYTLDPFGDAT
ncbi:MAG: hypothetical protein RSB59_06685, partial [Clostridia bacterium]